MDVGTPLSIEHYLCSPRGGAVGLEPSPERFTSPHFARATDTESPIPGLWLTGQDFVALGVPNCMFAGIITALRLLNWRERISFIARSVFIVARSSFVGTW